MKALYIYILYIRDIKIQRGKYMYRWTLRLIGQEKMGYNFIFTKFK